MDYEISKPVQSNRPPNTKPVSKLFCTQCGTPNHANAKFCYACGNQLAHTSTTTVHHANTNAPTHIAPEPEPKKEPTPLVAWGWLALFAPLLAAVFIAAITDPATKALIGIFGLVANIAALVIGIILVRSTNKFNKTNGKVILWIWGIIAILTFTVSFYNTYNTSRQQQSYQPQQSTSQQTTQPATPDPCQNSPDKMACWNSLPDRQ